MGRRIFIAGPLKQHELDYLGESLPSSRAAALRALRACAGQQRLREQTHGQRHWRCGVCRRCCLWAVSVE